MDEDDGHVPRLSREAVELWRAFGRTRLAQAVDVIESHFVPADAGKNQEEARDGR